MPPSYEPWRAIFDDTPLYRYAASHPPVRRLDENKRICLRACGDGRTIALEAATGLVLAHIFSGGMVRIAGISANPFVLQRDMSRIALDEAVGEQADVA